MPKPTDQSAVEKRGLRLLRAAEQIPRFRDSRQAKALIEAIGYQDSDLAVWLLKRGVDPGAKDSKGRSALWWAAALGQRAVIRELVNRGAALPEDVLMGPVKGADAGVVRFLLQRGANVNCVASKYTGLGHLHIKEVLLAAAIDMAAEHPEARVIPSLLVRAGARVNRLVLPAPFPGAENRSMLGLATYHGLLGTVKAMIAAGADVNLRDSRGRTALFEAAQRGQLSVAKELLRAGARPDVRDRAGMTPLEVVRQEERSPEMIATEWRISFGETVDERRREAEAAAWLRRRAQMIALLERHSVGRISFGSGRAGRY